MIGRFYALYAANRDEETEVRLFGQCASLRSSTLRLT